MLFLVNITAALLVSRLFHLISCLVMRKDARPTACDQTVVNLWAAKIIPLILTGIVAYSTYVVVVQVCGTSHTASAGRGLFVMLMGDTQWTTSCGRFPVVVGIPELAPRAPS